MEEELTAVKATLKQLKGVKRVVTAWPKDFAVLPCLVVQLAGERPADYRDNREYLTEVEWYVRVFSGSERMHYALCEAVRERMEALGYVRTFRWEEGGAEVWHTAFRFKKVI